MDTTILQVRAAMFGLSGLISISGMASSMGKTRRSYTASEQKNGTRRRQPRRPDIAGT